MKTINEFWQQHRAERIPEPAGRIQVQECQKSFYAGSLAALKAMANIDEDLTDNQQADAIEKIYAEIECFAKNITST